MLTFSTKRKGFFNIDSKFWGISLAYPIITYKRYTEGRFSFFIDLTTQIHIIKYSKLLDNEVYTTYTLDFLLLGFGFSTTISKRKFI